MLNSNENKNQLCSKLLNDKSRITNAQATVALKLNQGTISKSGCNRFGVSFFGYFFGQAKK
jgi:hypothetical protein